MHPIELFENFMEILAILISPAIAVAITLWYQTRKEKRERKDRLFQTLMVHRKAFPPTHDWVNGLNLIDVVFSDTPKVAALWHQYYSMLGSAKTDNEYRDRDHKYIELLSAMAQDLGYKNLQQTDIDKFYSPQAHQSQIAASNEIQTEFLRVLKNTQSIAAAPKPETPNA
jgi:hypothetical protein